MSETEAMLQIKAIDPSAHLALSECTGKWYVVSRVGISDGVMWRGITEHRAQTSAAIWAMFDALRAVSAPEAVVADVFEDLRRCYRWNGGAFAEVADPKADGFAA